jgi:predicted kinase
VPVECVILVGLPASGKSTFFARRFAGSHVHISKDLWPKSANKASRQARELDAALSAGRSVVIDNTNPAVADRAAVIEAARKHGARIVGYFFPATTREALGRNRRREGAARVPDVAVFTTAKRMVAPQRGEGFDELYRVAITPEGEFDVQPL